MRNALILSVLTLAPALGTAGAQTLSVNVGATVQFPPALQTLAGIVNLLSQGVQVSFLTPTNQTAANLNSGGGIVVNPAYPTTTRLTQVQVMTQTPSGPIREIYPLAQPVTVSTARPLAPQSIVVRDRDGQRRTLSQVMGRQAAWAKAPGLQKKPGGLPPGQYMKGDDHNGGHHR